jgi:hypothetical protein
MGKPLAHGGQGSGITKAEEAVDRAHAVVFL